MTKPEDLEALKQIAHRSPEGMGVSSSALEALGIDAATVRNLQLERLVDIVDDDGEPMVTVTADGLAGLRQQTSPLRGSSETS